MSSLAKLYDSPLEVGNQFALVISGVGGRVREKPTATPHTLKLMQVYADSAVYADCRVDASSMEIEAVGTKGVDNRIYFLPWSKDEIYRIRPKPADTKGQDGNLFFTPNLDGCMITIEGSPDAPTIYHCNCAPDTLSIKEQLALEKAPKTRNRMESQFRIQKMTTDFLTFRTIPKKNPPVPTHPTAEPAQFDMFDYDKGSRQELKPNAFFTFDMEQDLYYGSVFGVRKGGAWTFYKQCYRLERRKWSEKDEGSSPQSKPTVVHKETIKHSVVYCKKLWP